jgi:hypothetical protein
MNRLLPGLKRRDYKDLRDHSTHPELVARRFISSHPTHTIPFCKRALSRAPPCCPRKAPFGSLCIGETWLDGGRRAGAT